VGKDMFPISIDYLALGHLHVHQCVGKADHMRYSGSPIPMGYGEANQKKKVIVVEFDGITPGINELLVPCFQSLERITGSLDDILLKIEKLKDDNSNAWLEIEYTGFDVIGNLREQLDESLSGSSMEIRRIKNKRIIDRILNTIHKDENLDDLNVNDVFDRCLETFKVPLEERLEMTQSYNEIIKSFHEEDVNAE
jgi:exonuclease SbcD